MKTYCQLGYIKSNIHRLDPNVNGVRKSFIKMIPVGKFSHTGNTINQWYGWLPYNSNRSGFSII